MKALLKRFIREEEGLETIEWTLMAALVVLGFVAIWVTFKPQIQSVFTSLGTELTSAQTQ
ncbi:MAG: Flp family type IVb pilin [Planctomycetota bacterium]|jgi:Flp pilus assembly pilin Flp